MLISCSLYHFASPSVNLKYMVSSLNRSIKFLGMLSLSKQYLAKEKSRLDQLIKRNNSIIKKRYKKKNQ